MTSTMASFLNAVRPNGNGTTHNRLTVPAPAKMNKAFSASSTFLATTSLLGKVAVVTGSSRGIGAAIAKCLGEHGANVVVNYVNDIEAANDVVQAILSQGKGGAIAFGRIDILVLNSGIMGSKTLAELDEPFFTSHFDTNVRAPLFMAKAVAPLLPSPVTPNALVYLATKGAIEQISRVLAKDLGARGITVNTISPGPVDTPLFREGKPQSIIDSIAKQNPSRRLGEPDDIAPIVGFLASQAGQWINGQNIRVNGGFVV
ncbi:hypothetical protein CPB84DRAFT_1846439 [Gymnopilus junonius]|uniref:Uncharacterized protein n=1 Tax=Gymnopilus junonius TaxID=109634 RepID=A0A9P5NMG7_GYMJU|nr:hypothetical protein CPB84DRAFT_1846439 [Gymnopilus junonius]